jgi:hypothetical protein
LLPSYGERNIGIYSAEQCIVDAFRLAWSEGDDLAYRTASLVGATGNPVGSACEMSRNFPKALSAIVNTVQTLTHE